MKNHTNNKIKPIYQWALGEDLEIPSDLEPEVRGLKKMIENCNLRPRDPATYQRHVLRLMKAVYWLKWVHKNPDERQGDQERITKLGNLINSLKPLDKSDELNLSCYYDDTDLIRKFREACQREWEWLRRPFQLLVLNTLAEIYPFLTSFKISKNKGSKFMELAGIIDGYITNRVLTDPAASMADYAKRYRFDIEVYRRLEYHVSK